MSMSRREFGQTLAAAAVSMSVQPDGVSAQPRSAGEELWMPVGLQIVGRHRADSSVLQLASDRIEPDRPIRLLGLRAEMAMPDDAREGHTPTRGGW